MQMTLPADLIPLIVRNMSPLAFEVLSRLSRTWRRVILGLPAERLVAWVEEKVEKHKRHVLIGATDRTVTYKNPLTGGRRTVGMLRIASCMGRPVLAILYELALADTLHRAARRAPLPVRVAMGVVAFRRSARVLRAGWCAPICTALLSSGTRSPDELFLALGIVPKTSSASTPQARAVMDALDNLGRYSRTSRYYTVDLAFSHGRRLRLRRTAPGDAIWTDEDGNELSACSRVGTPEMHVRDHCPWYVRLDRLGDECLLLFPGRMR
jgi:hypothetical protein